MFLSTKPSLPFLLFLFLCHLPIKSTLNASSFKSPSSPFQQQPCSQCGQGQLPAVPSGPSTLKEHFAIFYRNFGRPLLIAALVYFSVQCVIAIGPSLSNRVNTTIRHKLTAADQQWLISIFDGWNIICIALLLVFLSLTSGLCYIRWGKGLFSQRTQNKKAKKQEEESRRRQTLYSRIS